MKEKYDAIVIGGGFFGCSLALFLRGKGKGVLLLEKEEGLLRRASYRNQARIHNGYHYPRSLLTGLRSRVNYPRFLRDYEDCVGAGFDAYYAVAGRFSNVTAAQFKTFCKRIGAPLAPAPKAVKALFSPHMIEDVFKVEEAAFDGMKLRRRLESKVKEAGVDVVLNAEVRRVGAGVTVSWTGGEARAEKVYNCAYSGLNDVLSSSGLRPIPLKHELAEVALVELPAGLRGLGVTVMCGPFFSTIPFPPKGLHSFTHVRYTPHAAWNGEGGRGEPKAPRSSFPHMVRDAMRYMPALEGTRYVESLWETKTVLPASENDDSRPILFQAVPEVPGLVNVLGGKMDNVFDILTEVERSMSALTAS